ncbi:hypothetical protein ALC56_04845 [Trachymyrmex septentrionalis]|uniref:Uncharacterized protein n=1 Tax=Trachymyrmex septentrionalis TaxID=34720 RepID=A0A195FJJ3_9HYME|nr:hypothetical protein ALC56_04845 [Trachymyrmex septentrionalis]
MAVCTAGERFSTCLFLLVVVVVFLRLRALCSELPSAWSVYYFRQENTRASDSRAATRSGKSQRLSAAYLPTRNMLNLLSLFPQYIAIYVDNIFFMHLHNYQDHKIDLSINGITINDNKEQKILFRLMYIIGDNLVLNTILAFSIYQDLILIIIDEFVINRDKSR